MYSPANPNPVRYCATVINVFIGCAGDASVPVGYDEAAGHEGEACDQVDAGYGKDIGCRWDRGLLRECIANHEGNAVGFDKLQMIRINRIDIKGERPERCLRDQLRGARSSGRTDEYGSAER